MANYYVRAAGSNSNGGTSWSDAWQTIVYATTTVTAGEHTIWCENVSLDVITVDTIITLATGVNLVSTSDTTNAPPTSIAVGATISSTTGGIDISINGLRNYFYGITISNASSATSALIGLGSSVSDVQVFDTCTFNNNSTSTSASTRIAGASSTNNEGRVITKNCVFKWASTSADMFVNGAWESYGDTFAATGSAPSPFISSQATLTRVVIQGADCSNLTGTLVIGSNPDPAEVKFIDCKMASSYTPLGTTSDGTATHVFIINSAGAGSDPAANYGTFAHYCHEGKTETEFTIYQSTNGCVYDGTNKCGWKITGLNATHFAPYFSPWFGEFNTDTSTSVTPRIEVLRNNDSTSAFTDKQIWGEFSYPGTSGYPKATLVNDGVSVVAAAGNQGTSALGDSDWAGNSGSCWYGKLEAPAGFTPSEIGMLSGRVVLGDNITVYATPRLFGI